ncbi:MAG: SPOR domain-containing protein [Methylococcaceae bacterium]|jgi:SPOR domain
MTKKQIHRRNSFSAEFNAEEEDDFILADLDLTRDKEEPSLVPLKHFNDDDEIIDSLLVRSEFEVKDDLEEDDRDAKSRVIDDIDLADKFSDVDQFIVEPVESAEQDRLTAVEEIQDLVIHSRTDFDEIQDEDAIDRLLVDAGFDNHDDEPEKTNDKSDGQRLDDTSEFALSVIESIEPAEQNKRIETEEVPVFASHFSADFDETLIEEVNDLLDEDASSSRAIDHVSWVNEFKERIAVATDNAIFDWKNSECAFDKDLDNSFLLQKENQEEVMPNPASNQTIYPQEPLNNESEIKAFSSVVAEQESIKEQISDYENKVKKAKFITYASLSFGMVALLSAVIMGVIVSSVKSDVSKLTELVSMLEEDMSSISEKNADMDINNSELPGELLNKKVNNVAGFDNSKAMTVLPENIKRSEATVEKGSSKKKMELQENGSDQSQLSPDLSKSNAVGGVKKQTDLNKSSVQKKIGIPAAEKNKPSETVVKVTTANKKTSNAKVASGWSVNLTTYKQLSDAKRKAAQLLEKGIPVKVTAVDINNSKSYQLNVGGFKNKENAALYAAKIKKSLNINAVLVR